MSLISKYLKNSSFFGQKGLLSLMWKDEKAHGPESQLGVIAQDVEPVVPQAVSTGQDGIKQVAYSMFIPVLIEAVKEVYAKLISHDQAVSVQDRSIASMKAEITNLNARDASKDQKIQQLEQENAVIKPYLCAKDPSAPICAH